jgi:KDO2-lipid IV(A) lauroyltransferase
MIQEYRYRLEYALLVSFMGFLSLMAMEQASQLSGWLARKVGPRLGINRVALKNLKMALPGRTDKEYEDILTRMWDNLGRMIAEYTDLEYFVPDIELVGVENLKRALEANRQAIIFSGHIGNWEIMAPTLLSYGIPVDLVYRAPNNPWVDKLLNRYRSLEGKLRTMPKSIRGTRQLVESVKIGRSVGILIDQKYNEGLPMPFFGHPAMTSPAFVQLAQKFDCPLVPFRVERIEKTQFRLSFYPPLQLYNENDADRPVKDVIAEAHALLESWIAERPDQWLWMHRRWIENRKKS